jgi:hypothetical protein
MLSILQRRKRFFVDLEISVASDKVAIWHCEKRLKICFLYQANKNSEEKFFEKIMVIRHGEAPFLECSSKGDKRFSAFYAKVNGKSIEEQYQGFKQFADGTTNLHWKQAKGKQAINQAEANVFYSQLWDQYIAQHPELLAILKASSGVSDIFGQENHCCQATELWRIRNKS